MPGNMVVDVRAVADLAALQRAVGAGLAGDRGVGLAEGELVGSLTAEAVARSIRAVEAALDAVASRVEELGRRTAWGAMTVDEVDATSADTLRRVPG